MKLVLLGPPMSGKGTQTERLCKEYGAEMISTGNMLRKHTSEGTELGKKAKAYMDRGDLVPDDLIIELIADKMDEMGQNLNFILDGFPRTISQAEALDTYLETRGERIEEAVQLVVSEDVLMKRMMGRLTCESCGATYAFSEDTNPDNKRCEKCDGKLIRRADDKVETLKNRLQVYAEQTKPLVQYYREKGILTDIDGTLSPEEVFQKISEAIGASNDRH